MDRADLKQEKEIASRERDEAFAERDALKVENERLKNELDNAIKNPRMFLSGDKSKVPKEIIKMVRGLRLREDGNISNTERTIRIIKNQAINEVLKVLEGG